MKFFNTAGPIKEDLHYNLSPLHRWDLEEVLMLIEQQKYFVLHAPRQTGKTSSLLALADYLNKGTKYAAVYANIEAAQSARNDVELGVKAILSEIALSAKNYLGETLLEDSWRAIFDKNGAVQALSGVLDFWSSQSAKPVVLFLDEIDALVGDTLVSVLRQIRAGYAKRPKNFPISIILCGVRDVRDYRIHLGNNDIVTGGSAFNIKAVSLKLGNFTQAETQELYLQHTAKTGQKFGEDIWNYIFDLTGGQPWLVNALAYEATMNMRENRDRSQVLTKAVFQQAKENLILRRDTHLDQLVDKLREPRVRRVIEPVLSGDGILEEIPTDDIQYVIDLGLIHKNATKTIAISNSIYQEIIPRELVWSVQYMLNQPQSWYLTKGGKLDMFKLLTAFQSFFRKHSEHWIERFDYKEAGPQLLMQAFLQRIVNGGGRIEREYGLGRGRTDLFVTFPYETGVQEIVIELKIRYDSLEKTIEKGIVQTKEYMDKCGAKEGYLIIFDRRKNVSWEEKIFFEQVEEIGIWGC